MLALVVVCWLSRDDAAFPFVTAVNDETDEADDAENDAATLISAVDATWSGVFMLAGLCGAAGGVTLCPDRESALECGLMILSDTEDAEEESIEIVDFEFVGENCWSCWFKGL